MKIGCNLCCGLPQKYANSNAILLFSTTLFPYALGNFKQRAVSLLDTCWGSAELSLNGET